MNKYKRKSKKKTLAMGIGILSSAAVVSTGFAAWVIAGGDSVTGTGNITAETVSNREHNIGGFDSDDGKKLGDIYFGHPEKMEATNAWLTNEDGKAENLVVTKRFTVEHLNSIGGTSADDETWYKQIFDVSQIKLTENFESTNDASYAKALSSTYTKNGKALTVVGEVPSTVYFDDKDATKAGIYIKLASTDDNDTDNYIGTFNLSIVFTWGTAFEGKNPYNYYNDGTKTRKEYSKEANELLSTIFKINTSFTLTLVTL